MTLSLSNVDVSLGARKVLRGLSLTLEAGDVLAIVGPNGAGKSTALRAFAGLVPPDSGAIALDGRDIAHYARDELGRAIAYLPQDRNVHWGLAVERVVSLGRLPHKSFASGMSGADRAAITAAMNRADVAGLAQRSATRLSGGERARVLMARALAQEARYLVADEPTAGLDPAHALSLFEELRSEARNGRGVAVALHDLALAARYATRVALIKDGYCMAVGPPAQVLSKEHLASAFGIDGIMTEVDGLPVFLPRAALRPTFPLT